MCWGLTRGAGGLNLAQKHPRTRSVVQSVSQPTSLPLSEADKEEQHPAGGQHAPGGWGIIPLHRVGGVKGGRHVGMVGLCLTIGAYLYAHFSVDFPAFKAFIHARQ